MDKLFPILILIFIDLAKPESGAPHFLFLLLVLIIIKIPSLKSLNQKEKKKKKFMSPLRIKLRSSMWQAGMIPPGQEC